MAAFRLISAFLLLVSCSTSAVHGADILPRQCSTLPDPTPINKFLLENPSVWISAASGEEAHAVPVTKCKSQNEGPQYKFYQVEEHSRLCESPPHQLNIVHYGWSNGSEGFPLLLYVPAQAIALFGLLLPGLLVVAIPWLAASLVIGTCGGLWFWLLSTRNTIFNMSSEQDSEVAGLYAQLQSTSGDDQSPGSASKSAPPESTVTKSWGPLSTGLRVIGKVLGFILGAIGSILAALQILISILALLAVIAVPFLAIGGIICWNVDFSVERAGPVALPDPNQGLNQQLAPMNLNLTLCKTPNLHFYVDCPDTNCTELGEPYGTRLPAGEPFKAPLIAQAFQSCPAKFGPLNITVLTVASIVGLYMYFLGLFIFGLASSSAATKRSGTETGTSSAPEEGDTNERDPVEVNPVKEESHTSQPATLI